MYGPPSTPNGLRLEKNLSNRALRTFSLNLDKGTLSCSSVRIAEASGILHAPYSYPSILEFSHHLWHPRSPYESAFYLDYDSQNPKLGVLSYCRAQIDDAPLPFTTIAYPLDMSSC